MQALTKAQLSHIENHKLYKTTHALTRMAQRGFNDQQIALVLKYGRVIYAKGVVFVEAARMMRQKYEHIEFHILGFLDAVNVSAISKDTVADWVSEGVIR